jgi:CubicO group peptidase (beta-lactamase class C family)
MHDSLLRIVAIVLAMGMPLVAPAAPDPTGDELSKLVEDAMADAGVVGLALTRVEQGSVADTRGFGLVESGGSDVTPETVFQAASLGKIAAAYATLILVEQGKLSLEQPLTDPRMVIPDGCAAPTIRTVLTHVSGMANNLLAPRFQPSCAADNTFRYSGQGFLALATEMQRASGMPAAELIAELVFRPLGMTHTRFGPAESGANVAHGHISLTGYAIGQALGRPFRGVGLAVVMSLVLALVAIPTWMGIWRGWRTAAVAWFVGVAAVALAAVIGVHGHTRAERELPPEWIPASLTTTAADMGRFAVELLSPRLLSATSRQQLFETQVNVSECIGWGLLMGTDRCGGRLTAWQWGSNLGFQGLLVLVPDAGKGVVILTNTGGGADSILPGQGGYPAAKRIAAGLLGIDGQWDLSN